MHGNPLPLPLPLAEEACTPAAARPRFHCSVASTSRAAGRSPSRGRPVMPSRWRRGAPNRKTTRLGTPFEVLLPLQFNDGRDVPDEWLADAVFEIVEYF